jgi:hypothetical protein
LSSYLLSQPFMLTSGDLYLGFYDLVADAATTNIAAIDTSQNGRSFRSTNATGPESFTAHASGTWIIRGQGGGVGSGGLLLEWDPPCNAAEVPDQDFAVYRGTIGSFTTPSSLSCSTAGANAYLAATTPSNSFFLVVPQTATDEGSYGVTSWGAERPPAAAACHAQTLGDCP